MGLQYSPSKEVEGRCGELMLAADAEARALAQHRFFHFFTDCESTTLCFSQHFY